MAQIKLEAIRHLKPLPIGNGAATWRTGLQRI